MALSEKEIIQAEKERLKKAIPCLFGEARSHAATVVNPARATERFPKSMLLLAGVSGAGLAVAFDNRDTLWREAKKRAPEKPAAAIGGSILRGAGVVARRALIYSLVGSTMGEVG